jgi:LuxR family transcriptional regulator, maltose regulon positive regulatory protein
MTMAIFRDDGIEHFDAPEFRFSDRVETHNPVRLRAVEIRTIAAKIGIPRGGKTLSRRRLNELLEKSSTQFTATLIVGRAGSGKTALASNFVKDRKPLAWYALDLADSDWSVFSHYLWATFFGKREAERRSSSGHKQNAHFDLLADITARFEMLSKGWPNVIVLDGIHNLFDSEWFGGFFELMIASLPSNSHLLMLSRSKPPNPLWRLRSKQVLNVVDEKLLAFSVSEAEELFAQNGLGRETARHAHCSAFGRAGKLIRIIESNKP